MPVHKYRSVAEMPRAGVYAPLDPENLRRACELSTLALRLSPRRFPAGVRRYRSVTESDEQRQLWERSAD